MADAKDPGKTAQTPTPWPGRPTSAPIQPPQVPVRGTGRVPDVIVDFAVDGGLLDVIVRNIGEGPAHRVRVTFEPSFTGPAGVSIPDLALFSRLEFLAPGNELRAFVDGIVSYFARRQPDVIAVTVTFHDDGGRGYRRRIRHDLGIYRDLPSAHRR